MKSLTFLFIILLSLSAFGQTSADVLATANNQTFTAKDLPPGAREAFENLPQTINDLRKSLLDQQVAQMMLETEAAARKMTVEKLLEKEVSAKVADPTDAQIQAVYDANRGQIGDKTVKETRPQIVAFLRRDLEQKAAIDFISTLKTKYKLTAGKDVNAPNLVPFDTLESFGDKKISVESFESKNKQALFEAKAVVYDQTRDALEQLLLAAVLTAEAKAQNLQTNDLIAREVTDKMREFSDAEREKLESNLRNNLFKKYNAKILLKDLTPIAQKISVEGGVSKGKIDAPVTIVMFSDFQCSHCAATDPIVERVVGEFPGKIRFVVRNFPLESIHANAFRAAVAAQAAGAQGKFFEYIALLYANQENLDDTSLKKYAAQIGLNQKQFDLDLGSEKFAAVVRRDLADGASYGITGTPTIFVNGVKARQNTAQAIRRQIEQALRIPN